jgi:tetratricopeptide (TPR) repeat protein
MARRNRSRSKAGPTVKPSCGPCRNPSKAAPLALGGLALALAVLAGVTWWPGWARERPSGVRAANATPSLAALSTVTPSTAAAAPAPKSLSELLALPPDELAKVDIAIMNLLCAKALPGSEGLDIEAVTKRLDEWATRVKAETDKYYPRFQRNPAENNNSEADFRMLTLITVLQLDLGVHYNMARVAQPDFRNSKDLFIHGTIGSDNGGTCASMPVLYIAVGRRLGYPLKLVLAREHPFIRWDGNGERLNIEGSGRGMNTFPDEHYRQWPHPIKDEWVQSGEFLRSLTAQEELADFLASRGHCLNDIGRFDEAAECYAAAARLNPKVQAYRYFIAVNKALKAHKQSGGKVAPRLPADPYAQ